MKLEVNIDVPVRTWLKRAALVAIVPVSVIALSGVVRAGGVTQFKDGETLSATKLNDNFASIEARLGAVESMVPTGTVIAFGGTTVPAGWLPCDGTILDSSKAEYAALYEAIGISYGGNTTSGMFNLPDFRGRFLRGVDGAAGNDPDAATRVASNPGGNEGNKIGSLQGSAVGHHTHGYIMPTGSDFSGNVQPPIPGGTKQAQTEANAGDGSSTETRPVNVSVHWLIKL